MVYLSRAPGPPLDRYIAAVWYCEMDPRPVALERVLPTGTAGLIVNLKEDRTRTYDAEAGYRCEELASGIVLCGTASRFAVIDTKEQEQVAGVVFRPGGAAAFFRMPAQETAGSHVPLDLIWGRRARSLRERLFEAEGAGTKLDVLERALQEMAAPGLVDGAIGFALEEFGRRPETARIAEVAEAAGMSARRFIERFRTAAGMTPKRYCRLLRFQRAVGQVKLGRRVDWTRVAMESGYYDQSHFIRDFREFAGIAPREYEAGRGEFQNHVKFVQSGGGAGVA